MIQVPCMDASALEVVTRQDVTMHAGTSCSTVIIAYAHFLHNNASACTHCIVIVCMHGHYCTIPLSLYTCTWVSWIVGIPLGSLLSSLPLQAGSTRRGVQDDVNCTYSLK